MLSIEDEIRSFLQTVASSGRGAGSAEGSIVGDVDGRLALRSFLWEKYGIQLSEEEILSIDLSKVTNVVRHKLADYGISVA